MTGMTFAFVPMTRTRAGQNTAADWVPLLEARPQQWAVMSRDFVKERSFATRRLIRKHFIRGFGYGRHLRPNISETWRHSR